MSLRRSSSAKAAFLSKLTVISLMTCVLMTICGSRRSTACASADLCASGLTMKAYNQILVSTKHTAAAGLGALIDFVSRDGLKLGNMEWMRQKMVDDIWPGGRFLG